MKRGDIWTVAGGADYAGKPRPAVIVQDDAFAATGSVTICLLTSDPTDAPLFRVKVAPGETSGLNRPSRIMVDKLTSVARARLGSRIGVLADDEIVQLNQALLLFLGLASPRR